MISVALILGCILLVGDECECQKKFSRKGIYDGIERVFIVVAGGVETKAIERIAAKKLRSRGLKLEKESVTTTFRHAMLAVIVTCRPDDSCLIHLAVSRIAFTGGRYKLRPYPIILYTVAKLTDRRVVIKATTAAIESFMEDYIEQRDLSRI